MKRCKICGGILSQDKVKYTSRWRDRSIGIKNISALVCKTCGQTYVNKHWASHLKRLERPLEREEFLKNPDAYMTPEQYFPEGGDHL
ncbi:MAG TPA: YgiT-type zinc finger protein [Clostridia bacterium]|jgi:YgiT-type zinc finger domain-containing protein|nr:YgiT-type zinc finger protein [Clostridia bacterium]